MKKTIYFLLLLVIMATACEKDDFCTLNPVTSKSLIIRFYDNANKTSTKEVASLNVWAESKEDSLFIDDTTDSLVVPLNVNTNKTIYNFSKAGVVEQFTINYTTENEHISRSCGFRTIFSNLSFSSSNTWIADFTVIDTTLENQEAAHVQVFH
jgi:hypothetical protein